mmetsp:Transcript_51249/g.59875  ORF Transcript_51249/g.59875 Transcript_51249/m.59875 type:complete len:83 (+) Transcript_51249:569-817(+)
MNVRSFQKQNHRWGNAASRTHSGKEGVRIQSDLTEEFPLHCHTNKYVVQREGFQSFEKSDDSEDLQDEDQEMGCHQWMEKMI